MEGVEQSATNLQQPFIDHGIRSHEDGGGGGCPPDEIIEETKKQLWRAAPLIAVFPASDFHHVCGSLRRASSLERLHGPWLLRLLPSLGLVSW